MNERKQERKKIGKNERMFLEEHSSIEIEIEKILS